MAKQGTSRAIPRLRFPEFRGSIEWTVANLAGVADFVSEKIAVSNLHPRDYISTENLLPDYGETVVATKLPEVASVTRYKRGDVLISNIRPYLKKVWRANRSGGASNDVIVVRAKPSLSDALLSLILRNDAFIAYVMRSAKGVKMPRGDLDAMREYPVAYPESDEQHKIADCLTWLGGVIAAQGRKVDALKAHKRGLMQQLFPREGETLPRLRFPEFRNAGHWRISALEPYIEEFRQTSSKQDEYEVLTSSRFGLVRQRDYYDNDRITDRDNVGFNVIPPNYLTYRSRSDDRRFYFNENDLGVTGIISIYYPVFRVHGGSNKFFIELLTHYSEQVGKHSVGTSQTVLSLNELRRIKLPVAIKEEQQHIAECLSSLDSQIAAESDRLAVLKTHKLGLMQQLFPAPEGG